MGKNYRNLENFPNCHKYIWMFIGFLRILEINLVYSFDDHTLLPPRFTTQPSRSFISEKRTKILQCPAIGFPHPKYQWFKDGVSLGDFSDNQYYRINITKKEDAGRYSCVAKNGAGAVFSENMELTIAYMGRFENLKENYYAIASGLAAVLPLPAIDSVPPPLVFWQTKQGPLKFSIKYALTLKNELIILSVDKSDEQPYCARAINSQLGREESSPYLYLNVTGNLQTEIGPTIIVAPESRKIVKNENVVVLECIANARPIHQIEIIWTKDGIPIERTGVSYTFNNPWNRSLSLLSVDLNHAGEYTCHVRLRTGRFSVVNATAVIDVLEPPSFTAEIQREVIGEYGTDIMLRCDAIGRPAPEVSWFKNAEIIEPSRKKYSMSERNLLIIKNLTNEDAAMYQCLAMNEVGAKSTYTWLKVKSITSIAETLPQNLTVPYGKDVTIDCNIPGSSTTSVIWFDNESRLINISDRMQIMPSGSLQILKLRAADSGTYKCTVTDEEGIISSKAHLNVIANTRVILPPKDVVGFLGSTALLHCKIISDPSLQHELNWYKCGYSDPIIQTSRIKALLDGSLEIRSLRPSDAGIYYCAVKSPGGNETLSARLTVIELPFAPINVKASRLVTKHPRAVNVSWIPGFDGNSPILYFLIEKREFQDLDLSDNDFNWKVTANNISASRRWEILNDLKAATFYQFRVIATNRVGEGAPSDPSNTVEIPEEVPSGPPLGFEGTARSSSEIILQWQSPLEEHANGRVTGYVIRYRLFGYNNNPWMYQNITIESQRRSLVKELITWKDYVIQIAAYNHVGVGAFSDAIKIRTKEGIPEAPPTNVRALAQNSTAVIVYWNPPDPQRINGISQGFKVQVWKFLHHNQNKDTREEEVKTITTQPNLLDPLAEHNIVISDLEKFTEYNFTVLCFTNAGDGARSKKVTVRTKEDVPGEVASFEYKELSDCSVKILWTAPKALNGLLIGYQLLYQIVDKPETLKIVNITSDVHSLIIGQLYAATYYWFQLVACTRVGSGVPRTIFLQTNLEPTLPLPPTNLAVSNVEAFSVVLQFSPAFDGNSAIKSWVTEAQSSRDIAWHKIFETAQSNTSTIAVIGLIPFTQYRLRLIAINAVGSSVPSSPTRMFQTIQSKPLHSPFNFSARAINATTLRLRWIPLQQEEWYGNPVGYNITFREVGKKGDEDSFSLFVVHTASYCVLKNLKAWTFYDATITACNEVGCSRNKSSVMERTNEAAPTSGPVIVEAVPLSSTTISVRWGEIPPEHRHGLIGGYKVFFRRLNGEEVADYKIVPENISYAITLKELKKYVVYEIQVLAFTRGGDGALSNPPVRVQTLEDIPGVPYNISFPCVSLTNVRMTWETPEEPNGIILGFRVAYSMNGSAQFNYSRDLLATQKMFDANELLPKNYYVFSIVARNRMGWGEISYSLVYTTNDREKPKSPSAPLTSNSQIQAREVTLRWIPGFDGNAPLRFYNVQLREVGGLWMTLPERITPTSVSYKIENLKPFTAYQFRIRAVNDLGPSDFSSESKIIRTLPAAPSVEISDLQVSPIGNANVYVRWTPLKKIFWNGDSVMGGYRVLFEMISDMPGTNSAIKQEDVTGIDIGSVVLRNLSRGKNYEIVVCPFNSYGLGPAAGPIAVYIGDSVPAEAPGSVNAIAISSTEVRLTWESAEKDTEGGNILGYKVYFLKHSTSELDFNEEMEIVPPLTTSYTLICLEKYTAYRIQILVYNAAGDGPRSSSVMVMTQPDLPEQPASLRFEEVTLQSLKVSWDAPNKCNGELRGYLVTYETVTESEKFTKQVKQLVNGTSLHILNLDEGQTYKFSVCAKTIDFGPAIIGNVTTGPQEGSPKAPRELSLIKVQANVEMQWSNDLSGESSILGYYIQYKKHDDLRWITLTKTTSGSTDRFCVSFRSLVPSTIYTFRVFAYNHYGVSYPATSRTTVLIPSKLYSEYIRQQPKPFYGQIWFIASAASISVVILVIIIIVFCIKSKTHKPTQEKQKCFSQPTGTSFEERQELSIDLYSKTESFISGIVANSNNLPLGRKGSLALVKNPPRPSPASVTYHSDEENLKFYENQDDSSITEKPSEISSSSEQNSESENESIRSDPHSFVNHYANINESLRQSWKRQKLVRNYSSFTDSEAEGSAVISLNGGQIIVNNMARSRAPLPGFTSFV